MFTLSVFVQLLNGITSSEVPFIEALNIPTQPLQEHDFTLSSLCGSEASSLIYG